MTKYALESLQRLHHVCQCLIYDALQDYGRTEWKQTLRDLEEVPNVAFQDVLKELHTTWGIKNLIGAHSNLVVTWMDRP